MGSSSHAHVQESRSAFIPATRKEREILPHSIAMALGSAMPQPSATLESAKSPQAPTIRRGSVNPRPLFNVSNIVVVIDADYHEVSDVSAYKSSMLNDRTPTTIVTILEPGH